MRTFLIRLFIFICLISLFGEIVVRFYRLTSDIPRRQVLESGIQNYIPGQKGYYKKAQTPWSVNKYGWLGRADVNEENVISIIGDSYIENIMNPKSCNQGSILKNHFPNIGFFEAGRSGVTFIEGLEIAKMLDSSINPKAHLLYVSGNDFKESFTHKKRYANRMQIDIENENIYLGKLKSPGLKKLLYTSKLVYYLYLRFPLFVNKENRGESKKKPINQDIIDADSYVKLFKYCKNNYSVKKITLVFHPSTNTQIIKFSKEYGFQTLQLNANKDSKSWALGEHDGHWSCYGHNQVALQVKEYIKTISY